MKTLKDYMKISKPEYIQLIFGDYHIINIDTHLEGSLALLRIFKKEKFSNSVYYATQSLLKCWY